MCSGREAGLVCNSSTLNHPKQLKHLNYPLVPLNFLKSCFPGQRLLNEEGELQLNRRYLGFVICQKWKKKIEMFHD